MRSPELQDHPAPFLILTVCTGNICRSPLAEQVLRERLADELGAEVRSAGLHASVGVTMDSLSAERSQHYGGDPADSFGEQITDSHTAEAGLILTMTRRQRDDLVQQFPRAARRTFTISEFTRLAEATSDGDPLLRERVERARRSRGVTQLTDEDDVPDPIGASVSVHDRVAAQIVGYIDRIATVLSQPDQANQAR